MTTDPIADAIERLRQGRQEAIQEVRRIEMAIANLEQLRQQPAASVPNPEELVGTRPSVKSMMLQLLVESDRDWSVAEVLAEYDRRGFPIQAKDPKNALRAAVAEANRDGAIFRTALGRYKSAKWYPAAEPSAEELPDDEPF
jgi:hypothetical protein